MIASRHHGGPAWRMVGAAQLLLVPLCVCGCSTMRISTDHDPRFDFSGLQSWSWLDAPKEESSDPRLDDPLLKRRIEAAVEDQLAGMGFKQVASDQADFMVGYHLAIQRKLDVSVVNDYYGYAPGPSWEANYYGRSWGYYAPVGPPATRTVTREYEEGTLVLDIVSARSKELIWRGAARAELDEQPTAEQRERRIREAVRRMLEHFPPDDASR